MSERVGHLSVNGVQREVSLGRSRDLLSALRDELGLTGAKYGCGEGECGACTVLVDGEARTACTLLVSEVLGREVTTVEGLARSGRLHPVQRAFVELGAMQCGYCTPGMVVSSVALLNRHPDPSSEEIRRALDGNLCRCGGYPRIVRAVRLAADALREQGEREP